MIAVREGLTAQEYHHIVPNPANPDYREDTIIHIVGLDSNGNPVLLALRAAEIDAIASLLPPNKGE